MPFPIGGLNQHRIDLSLNPSCFTQDKTRAIDNWVKESIKSYPKKAKTILKDMALMVWEAQGGVPLFQFSGKNNLPMSWNRPQDGETNYIRYEIGHMISKNYGGTSEVENLCYQSARCNQHIQSSLLLEEVIDAYFSNNQEVLDRVDSLKTLHQSYKWFEKKKELETLLT